MKTQALLLCLVALAATASATVYFKETFDGDVFSRWIQSDWKKNDGTAGKFDVSAGEWYGDAEKDKGLRTTEDARFYAISSKFDKFSNAGKDLVIQFQVRFPQKIDCGGGYIKVLKSSIEPKKFTGDTEYNIMFGPDICGTSTKRVHVIFSHNGKNHLIKKEIRAEGDQTSHVYTLIVRPDDTYEVRVDNDKKESGKLSEDWDFSAPKKIKDPNAKKPADWVDSPKMDDPNDKKPADWDAIPKEIPDPEAEKPADWDDENDGAWEPPTIPNPDYKGEWKPRQIDNPNYKGPWIHPEIDNPEYVDYTDLYKYDDFGGVGVDVWQVKAGTIFDNIIITDSVSEAERFYRDTFEASKDKEKEMFDAAEKKKRDEEDAQRKKIEEEREKQDKSSKASSSSGSKDEDDDDDDDDDDDAADKIKDKVHEDL